MATGDRTNDASSYFWAPVHAQTPFELLQRRLLAIFALFIGATGAGLSLLSGFGQGWQAPTTLAGLAYTALILVLLVALPGRLSTLSLGRAIAGTSALCLCAFLLVSQDRSQSLSLLMLVNLMALVLTVRLFDWVLATAAFAGCILFVQLYPLSTGATLNPALLLTSLAALVFTPAVLRLLVVRLSEDAQSQTVSEERFRIIFEHAPVAIAIFDTSLRYVAHTRRWATDYGFPGQDFTGRHHYDVFPEIGEKWKDDHRRNLAGEMLHDPEEAFPRGDGSTDYVDWTNVPWRLADGSIGGIIMATQVVTDQVNQRLELEQLNRDLENFAATAAHDLKGPLRRISAFGDLIEQRYNDDLPEPVRPLIRQMTVGARQSQILVSHLLEYAQMRDGSVTYASVRLSDFLETFMTDSAAPIEDADLTLKREGDAVCRANEDMLAQIFRNLLSNSIKYAASENLEITLTIKTEADAVVLDWRDNGPGFDSRFEERVFDMFEQLQTEAVVDSTGIGLALVKRAMERMNGSVSAQGNPGAGACFTLRLPHG